MCRVGMWANEHCTFVAAMIVAIEVALQWCSRSKIEFLDEQI
jgi:hypothetical protein